VELISVLVISVVAIAAAIVLAQNVLKLAKNTFQFKRTEYAFRSYSALFLLIVSKDLIF
jgi:hypothetical protein